MAYAATFRMHDKDQKTTLVALDSFLVEDSADDNDTKYTTTANIKTYMDTYYQPLEATLTDIADGTIAENLVNTTYPWAVTEGGTGSGNATGARTNLGVAASGANSDITSLAGLTTPLTVPQGGMGAGTFTDGGILLGSGTGAITALGAATNGQIPIGDGTTDPVLATLTGTANEVTVTNGAGAITLSMATGVNATKLGDGTVSSTEYQYIGTLTSNAQDQLDARCLESVFGTAIGTGLLLDSTTLKVSAILQKYHGVDPSTAVLAMLGSDNDTAILNSIGDGISGLDDTTLAAEDYLIFWDYSDNSTLKKVDADELRNVNATTEVIGNVELATYTEVNEGNSTKVVTPDALAGSYYGWKDIGWTIHDDDSNTTIADGKKGYAVPEAMSTMEIRDFTCSVVDLNGATGDATVVMLRRVRAGVSADMLSVGVTIGYNEYTASDETVDTNNDDLNTGDLLFCDIDGITSGHPHIGLSCTATAHRP